MSETKYHTLDGFPKSMSPSSHAVEADGFIFLTGQFGRDLADTDAPLPDGIQAQTERTLQNMTKVLSALGLSLENVVSVRAFLTNFKRDYDNMNVAYAKFFQGNARPTRTCVGVTDLVRDALIEIDCIARR